MKVRKGSGPEITPKVIDWLHHCWEVTERGEKLQPDPFYDRNEVLTEDVVGVVLAEIEELIENELKKYPGYHRQAQGISQSEYLVPPAFDKLDWPQRLAIVQGVDRVFQEYRDDEAEEPKPEPAPVDYGSY